MTVQAALTSMTRAIRLLLAVAACLSIGGLVAEWIGRTPAHAADGTRVVPGERNASSDLDGGPLAGGAVEASDQHRAGLSHANDSATPAGEGAAPAQLLSPQPARHALIDRGSDELGSPLTVVLEASQGQVVTKGAHLLHYRAAPRTSARDSGTSLELLERHQVAEPPLTLSLRVELGDRIELAGEEWFTVSADIDRTTLRAGRTTLPLVVRTQLRGIVREFGADATPLAADLVIRSERDPTAEFAQRTEGEFAIAPPFPPPWTVEARREGYAVSERRGVDGRASLRIELARPTTLVGTVRDENGEPIGGTAIRCGRFGVLPVDERVVAHSDAAGAFTLADVPLAPIVLSTHRDGYAPMRREATVEELRSGRFDLVLEREARFAGRVVDPAGRPIAGAQLVIGSLTDHLVVGSITSDARGEFDMPWVAAKRLYHVEVRAAGFAPLDAGPLRAPDESIELRLAALRDLEVEVVDRDGRPLFGAEVLARPLHELREHESNDTPLGSAIVRTDERGRAILRGLVPSPVRLFVAAPGHRLFERELATFAAAPESAPLRVMLAPARTRRTRVVGGDGEPLPQVTAVAAIANRHGGWLPHPLAPRFRSDADGWITFPDDGGPAGSWLCERPDGASARFQSLGDRDESTWRWPDCGALEIELDAALANRAGALHLLIDRADGSELALRPEPGRRIRLESQPSGTTRVRLLDEWLSSTWHTYAGQEVQVQTIANATTVVRLQAAGTGRASGRVVAAREPFATTAQVVALRPDAPPCALTHTASLEFDGCFTLLSLDPGDWSILALASSATALAVASEPVRLLDGGAIESLELRIDRTARRIVLQDRGTGTPIAGARVELSGGGGELLATIASDGEGAFDWRGELAAPLAVTVSAAGFRPRRIERDELARGGTLALERCEPLLARARIKVLDARGIPQPGVAVALAAKDGTTANVPLLVTRTNESGDADLAASPGRFLLFCEGVSLELELCTAARTEATLSVERR